MWMFVVLLIGCVSLREDPDTILATVAASLAHPTLSHVSDDDQTPFDHPDLPGPQENDDLSPAGDDLGDDAMQVALHLPEWEWSSPSVLSNANQIAVPTG